MLWTLVRRRHHAITDRTTFSDIASVRAKMPIVSESLQIYLHVSTILLAAYKYTFLLNYLIFLHKPPQKKNEKNQCLPQEGLPTLISF